MSTDVVSFSKAPLPDISEMEGNRRAVQLGLTFCEAGLAKMGVELGSYKYRNFPQGIVFKKGIGSFEGQPWQQVKKWEPSLLFFLDWGRLFFVTAETSKAFFASLEGNKEISFSFQGLQKSLEKLVKKGAITSEEKEVFLKTIPSHLEEKEYVSGVEGRAIALAHRCVREGRGMEAIHWLVNAKKFLLQKPRGAGSQTAVSLNEVVDLSAFWSGTKITKISNIEMFLADMEEIVDAAASSPFIKEIKLVGTPNVVCEACESLGRFLRQTKTLEKLFIGVYSSEHHFDYVEALTGGLKANSTVRELIIKDCLDSGGVVKLAEALSSSHSKIDCLTLYAPRLNDVGAQFLSDLLRKKSNLRLHLEDCLEVSRGQACAMLRDFGGRVEIINPFYTV